MNSTEPRVFVSYCWSNPDHEQWVLELATELSQSGVHVIFDKWDLREGNDSIAFMESMVTDDSISKVIIVCDEEYCLRADGRRGGVGTETQIISKNVYEKQNQKKFVAVIAERDAAGQPHLPVYYKSRIYIDLSESEKYAEGFEKLLRWIFDKPLYVRPETGKPPSFITESSVSTSRTSALAKRVIEGFRGDKSYSTGALKEYLLAFSHNLESFRIKRDVEFIDDEIIQSINDFEASRNEYVSVVNNLAIYGDQSEYVREVHGFFEYSIPYFDPPEGMNRYSKLEFDNFKFFIHELFLYSIAILLRNGKSGAALYLFSTPYYIEKDPDRGASENVNFTFIRQYLQSFDVHNSRLSLKRLSLRADLLEKRSKSSGIPFNNLMQADFICFLRAEITQAGNYERWWPETLLFAGRYHGPMEIFARSESKAFLGPTLALLGVSDLDELKVLVADFSAGKRQLPRWEFDTINPGRLLGIDKLGTRI